MNMRYGCLVDRNDRDKGRSESQARGTIVSKRPSGPVSTNERIIAEWLFRNEYPYSVKW